MIPQSWPSDAVRRHVLVPFGTRTEVIRPAPVVSALRAGAVLADPATDALLGPDEPGCTDGAPPWRDAA